MPGPDYILDIDGVTPPPPPPEAPQEARAGVASGTTASGAGAASGAASGARAWIAVKWTCCSVYSRIYKHRAGDRYEGRCPKCMKQVSAKVGPGGTDRRFFEAG